MLEKKENQLRRLVIAASDLSLARRFATCLLKQHLHTEKNQDQQLIRLALQTSLVVTYSRQFVKSKGGSTDIPSVLFGRHLRTLNEAEKRLHERIVNMRNNIYAHSNGDEYEMQFQEVDIQEWGLIQVWPMSRNPQSPLETSELENFVTIVDKLNESVWQHRKELEAELFRRSSS